MSACLAFPSGALCAPWGRIPAPMGAWDFGGLPARLAGLGLAAPASPAPGGVLRVLRALQPAEGASARPAGPRHPDRRGGGAGCGVRRLDALLGIATGT